MRSSAAPHTSTRHTIYSHTIYAPPNPPHRLLGRHRAGTQRSGTQSRTQRRESPGVPFRTPARCREKTGAQCQVQVPQSRRHALLSSNVPNHHPRARTACRSAPPILFRCSLLARQLSTVWKTYSRRHPGLSLADLDCLVPWRTAKGPHSHWTSQRAPPGSRRFRLGVNHDGTARGHPQCDEMAADC